MSLIFYTIGFVAAIIAKESFKYGKLVFIYYLVMGLIVLIFGLLTTGHV